MFSKKRTMKVLVGLLLAGCVGANLLLQRQNLDLRRSIFPDYSNLELPEEGFQLDSFRSRTLAGGEIDIAFEEPGVERIFLFFNPDCRFSYVQLPFWRKLIEDNRSFQILGFVPDGQDPSRVTSLLREHGISRLQVAYLPKSLLRRFKLNLSPLTLVVRPDGKVRKCWPGRWGFQTMKEAYGLTHAGQPLS